MSVKIPEATPPGDYLIRHEIIALHIATTQGGAEFYRVSKGDVTPIHPSDTVSLPGAYSDTDPGILVPTVSLSLAVQYISAHPRAQIFDPVKNYQFPGPAISNVVTGSSGNSSKSNRPLATILFVHAVSAEVWPTADARVAPCFIAITFLSLAVRY